LALSDIRKQVQHTIETYNLLTSGDGIVVGVSGGPDSVCLLHILLGLRDRYDLRLYVAHLHHGARGKEADADAEYVASLAHKWGLPTTIDRQDIPALAREHRLAFEETARRVRYAFLARVASETAASKIAVGHNADDQAETVLMHLLRGTGPAGLRGMLPSTPLHTYRLNGFMDPTVPQTVSLIRPLLEVPRSDIEHYCTINNIAPRLDRSNLDTTYFRNRLRHELMPTLRTVNPKIGTQLCRTAQVVSADYELLAQLRNDAWTDVLLAAQKTSIIFDKARWQALPTALQRATLRHAAYQLRKSLRDVGFVHIENARMVARGGETGAQATLPMGLALTVGYDTLTLGNIDDATPALPDDPLLWGAGRTTVQVPGTTPLSGQEWTLEAQVLPEWDLKRIAANQDVWTAYFDLEKLGKPLALRSRRPGDRFRPQGMQGHSCKLSAFMINEKIPQPWRAHVPLLEADGEIVWVCGYRTADGVTVGPDTGTVLRLRFTRLTLETEGALDYEDYPGC
jgi:tRNA(Ile)-lysidine synthase